MNHKSTAALPSRDPLLQHPRSRLLSGSTLPSIIVRLPRQQLHVDAQHDPWRARRVWTSWMPRHLPRKVSCRTFDREPLLDVPRATPIRRPRHRDAGREVDRVCPLLLAGLTVGPRFSDVDRPLSPNLMILAISIPTVTLEPRRRCKLPEPRPDTAALAARPAPGPAHRSPGSD